MVTLIDNLRLNQEQREQVQEILRHHPLSPNSFSWINIDELKKGIEEKVSGDDVKVVVASGGLEVYDPKENDDFFVFNSSHNTRDGTMNMKTYLWIIDHPLQFHRAALDDLRDYMQKHKGRKVKIIEADTSNMGLSITRLCAICKELSDFDCRLLIGAAPEKDMFKVRKKASIVLLNGDQLYREDIRHLLDLDSLDFGVIKQCPDPYIRRLSEVFPPVFTGEGFKQLREHYAEQGVSEDKIESYLALHSIMSGRAYRLKKRISGKFQLQD
jgi:hypothetical protein